MILGSEAGWDFLSALNVVCSQPGAEKRMNVPRGRELSACYAGCGPWRDVNGDRIHRTRTDRGRRIDFNRGVALHRNDLTYGAGDRDMAVVLASSACGEGGRFK